MAKLSDETIDGIPVLHLIGSLTQDAVPALEKRLNALVAGNPPRAVIDISKVDAITTPAITLFLGAVRSVESKKGKIVFANVHGITGDIFARCRLDAIFTITEDLASAVKIAREA